MSLASNLSSYIPSYKRIRLAGRFIANRPG